MHAMYRVKSSPSLTGPYRAALISVSCSPQPAGHQPKPQDHGYGAIKHLVVFPLLLHSFSCYNTVCITYICLYYIQ